MRKQSKILNKRFYNRDTLKVAQELLGCFLIRKIGQKIICGRIIEVEAYIGEDDLACHASKGRTPRTEIMYGHAGHAYVYMIYGMYHCLNIVTEKKDFPAAVLIRAIQIEGVEHKKTNGPGKLCKFLQIDRKLNGWDLTKGDRLWIEKSYKVRKVHPVKSSCAGPPKEEFNRVNKVKKSKRIGIDYARHCKHYLWRFTLPDTKSRLKIKA